MSEVMCLAEDNGIKMFYNETDSNNMNQGDVLKLSELFEKI
jgi:hypothetical protein